MIDALYCRSEAVLLAMHVWLYVVAVLYMVSDAGRPHGAVGQWAGSDLATRSDGNRSVGSVVAHRRAAGR